MTYAIAAGFIEHLLAKTIRKMLGSETADEVGAAPGGKSGSRADLSTEKDIDHQIHGNHRSRIYCSQPRARRHAF
jgi:hypothetical protein